MIAIFMVSHYRSSILFLVSCFIGRYIRVVVVVVFFGVMRRRVL